MATAIVTGSSSGIGEAIVLMLLEEGYHVIGLSRTQGTITHPEFKHHPCDLSDIKVLEGLKNIISSYSDLSLLVNAAGFGRFEPHENLSISIISQMMTLNLTAPIVLSNLALRQLKTNHGQIVNITSIEATRHSKFSALYSATKAGLRAFGHSLYEEIRSSGVNVLTINPDMTDTSFFDDLRFGVAEEEDAKLYASDIADMLRSSLHMRSGSAATEITLRARRFRIKKK